MVLNGGRVHTKMRTYLAHRWRKAVLLHVFIYEIQDGLLTFGKHGTFYTVQLFGKSRRSEFAYANRDHAITWLTAQRRGTAWNRIAGSRRSSHCWCFRF